MKRIVPSFLFLIAMCFLFALPISLHAQLNNTFNDIFYEFLYNRLKLSGTTSDHKEHFKESAEEANLLLTPALNNLITNNISSFPLSSTTAGVSFDFSTGIPVKVSGSLGPIFSENGETTGKGIITLGLNYTSLNLTKIRGVDLEKMKFSFTHQDADTNNTLGGISNFTEGDLMDVYLGTKIHANLAVISSTIGLTDNLDLGIAVPIIQVGISGTARAVINSYTYAKIGEAVHFFAGDKTHPILESNQQYDKSITGIGDIAVRLKYAIFRSSGARGALLIDARIPSGKQDDFLGKGKGTIRISGILSKKYEDFTPHLNLGYEKNIADFISDKLVLIGGFDQKVSSSLTFAFDFLADIDANKDKTVKIYPGTRYVIDQSMPSDTTSKVVRTVELSNIPDRDDDNLFNVSTGFRIAFSENFILLTNILVPLNDAGLRSSLALTVGLGLNF